MGYHIHESQLDTLLETWREDYTIYAPKRFSGRSSDTEIVRYGEIASANEIVFDERSAYSFKEVLTPISQTLFYFTESQTREPEAPQKGAVIFMRSCDLHALTRLDDMYLQNGPADIYYRRLRENIKLVLMGCSESFDDCFCVSMGTNKSDDYDLSIDRQNDGSFLINCRDSAWAAQLDALGAEKQDVTPAFVTENKVRVTIPDNLSHTVAESSIWDEYDSRCIACGRCDAICPEYISFSHAVNRLGDAMKEVNAHD